jgi:hypothetical protein
MTRARPGSYTRHCCARAFTCAQKVRARRRRLHVALLGGGRLRRVPGDAARPGPGAGKRPGASGCDVRGRGARPLRRSDYRRAFDGRRRRPAIRRLSRDGRATPRAHLRDERGALSSARRPGPQSPSHGPRSGGLLTFPRCPARDRPASCGPGPGNHRARLVGPNRTARRRSLATRGTRGAVARRLARSPVPPRLSLDGPPDAGAAGGGLAPRRSLRTERHRLGGHGAPSCPRRGLGL